MLNFNIFLEYWIPNIEYCLFNDKNRREISSVITIKYAKINIDFEDLKNKYKDYTWSLIINTHKIIKKMSYLKFVKKLGLNLSDGKMNCGTWCGGGSYGNCWNDNKHIVSADTPLEPDEFDDILLAVAPNINFLMYKKIKKCCVDLNESHIHDYYGGGTTDYNWVIDVEKLYKMLVEFNLIDEEDYL